MSKLKWLLATMVGSVFLLSGCAFLGFNASEDATIGVIGGADGPTAVFVSTQLSPRVLSILIPLAIIVIAVAIGAIFYILKKRK